MNIFQPLRGAAVAGILTLALATPFTSFAHDQRCAMQGEAMQSGPEDRSQMAKMHLDHEATLLEIKASQQGAWDNYVAANLALMSAFSNAPMAPDVDAASAMRQHADHAAAFAQNLSRLADATEKLQAVLSEDQRKVLDRLVRMHSHFGGMHQGDGHMMHGMHGRGDGEHDHGAAGKPGPETSPKASTPGKTKR